MGVSGTCTSGGLPLRGHKTGGPRAPPSRRKLAGESLMAPAFQFCPLPGLRRGSQCQRGRAAFHLPNVVAWGSTAKAAIAAAAATLRSGPSGFSKNGGKSPAGRGARPDGVTSLPDRAAQTLRAPGPSFWNGAKVSAQTRHLPGPPGEGGNLRGNYASRDASAHALSLLMFGV